MECVVAREQLAERVLNVLEEDGAELRAHLAWCAGCRKEERELSEGGELLALLEPGEPPADLERRVVERVARAAGTRGRRGRGPVAVALAAVLAAVLAVGWGAAMAGRASRLDGEAELARTAAAKAAREFGVLLEDLSGRGVREAGLRPVTGSGGGRALVYDSDVPGASDWALVVVGGLPEEDGPYRARLRGKEGTVRVGRLWPSAEGRLAAYALYGELPAGLTQVLVSDSSGAVVLRGALAAR